MIESLNCPIGTYLHFLTGHRCFDIKRGFEDYHSEYAILMTIAFLYEKKLAKKNLAMEFDVVRI